MTNSYHLGVDVGASRVHAATARYTSSRNERVEPCVLSTTGDDMSASMWVSREGDLEFGAIASAWAREQPEAIVGDLRRRIGTGIPFLVAGHRVSRRFRRQPQHVCRKHRGGRCAGRR